MSVKTKERNIHVEILRIVAMIMIIIGHSIGHTHLLENMSSKDINYYLLLLLRIICNMATNVYVLMSGYYLCDKVFMVKRIVNLWVQVFFYSFGIYIILITAGFVPFAFGDFIKVVLPVSGNQYWFAEYI